MLGIVVKRLLTWTQIYLWNEARRLVKVSDCMPFTLNIMFGFVRVSFGLVRSTSLLLPSTSAPPPHLPPSPTYPVHVCGLVLRNGPCDCHILVKLHLPRRQRELQRLLSEPRQRVGGVQLKKKQWVRTRSKSVIRHDRLNARTRIIMPNAMAG